MYRYPPPAQQLCLANFGLCHHKPQSVRQVWVVPKEMRVMPKPVGYVVVCYCLHWGVWELWDPHAYI